MAPGHDTTGFHKVLQQISRETGDGSLSPFSETENRPLSLAAKEAGNRISFGEFQSSDPERIVA